MAVIYAIPGFACTEKLFSRLHLEGHTLKVLSWPQPEKHYTLPEYARCFLPQIETGEPFYLLGVSFGGMIAAELAELLQPQKVILISGCKNRGELPFPIRLLKYVPIHLLLSERMHKFVGLHSLWIISMERKLRPELAAMMNSMPPDYFRRCVHYIANWSRRSNKTKFCHIHGDRDRLLWYWPLKNVDYTVKGGGHAMIIYQAEEISRYIRSCLT